MIDTKRARDKMFENKSGPKKRTNDENLVLIMNPSLKIIINSISILIVSAFFFFAIYLTHIDKIFGVPFLCFSAIVLSGLIFSILNDNKICIVIENEKIIVNGLLYKKSIDLKNVIRAELTAEGIVFISKNKSLFIDECYFKNINEIHELKKLADDIISKKTT